MSLYFKLENLPDNLRTQAERQMKGKSYLPPHPPPSPVQKKRNPNIRVKHSDNKPRATPFPNSSFASPSKSPKDSLSLQPHSPLSFAPPPTRNLRSAKMSRTEQDFQAQILHGAGRFEAITLVLEGGSRYTPDFLVMMDGLPTLIEVKGSYRLQSEGRAHTAFLEAASQFSSIFQFLWVSKNKDKSWDIKSVIPSSLQDADSDSPAKEVL